FLSMSCLGVVSCCIPGRPCVPSLPSRREARREAAPRARLLSAFATGAAAGSRPAGIHLIAFIDPAPLWIGARARPGVAPALILRAIRVIPTLPAPVVPAIVAPAAVVGGMRAVIPLAGLRRLVALRLGGGWVLAPPRGLSASAALPLRRSLLLG